MKPRTCETCRDRDKSMKKEPCLTCCTVFPNDKTFHKYRPRRTWILWLILLIVAVAGLALCVISAIEDQARIDAIKPTTTTHTFMFHNQVNYILADYIPYDDGWFYSLGRKDWKVTSYIVWEITQQSYHTIGATIAGTNINQINVEGR